MANEAATTSHQVAHEAHTNENRVRVHDFNELEPLRVPSESPFKHHHNETRRERFLAWIKFHFVWIVYATMILQIGANVGLLAALPTTLTDDEHYIRMPLTNSIIKSQSVPIYAPCFINQVLLGEWHVVRKRIHVNEGDAQGILGVVVLLMLAVGVDACVLIQNHIRLVELRHSDGKENSSIYDSLCLKTYLSLSRDTDKVVLSPRKALIENYQCCGSKLSLNESTYFLANITVDPDVNATDTEMLASRGLTCCNSACSCNMRNTGNYRICLTKYMETMSGVYALTYPIYVIFILATTSSLLTFLHFNHSVRT